MTTPQVRPPPCLNHSPRDWPFRRSPRDNAPTAVLNTRSRTGTTSGLVAYWAPGGAASVIECLSEPRGEDLIGQRPSAAPLL